MNKMMLIDANALGHVVKHATKQLSFRGDHTGVIFGFIQKLFKIQSEVLADDLVFCWDGSRDELLRRDLLPTYKEVNEKKKTEQDIELDRIARPQFKRLRLEVLPKIGFANQLLYEGFEADDVIAQIVNQYNGSIQIFIVSRDNDMHQLLSSTVSMFDPVKLGYFTREAFIRKWGIEPQDWDCVKAIAGCSGDNVPGVPGVKEKTAIKFLKGELGSHTVKHKAILEMEEDCIENLRLVKLPFEAMEPVELYEDNLSVQNFREVCHEFGFKSLVDKDEDFVTLFGGER
jgi:5'-3' exonuclease